MASAARCTASGTRSDPDQSNYRLIANILQEPLGGNFAALLLFHRLLIDPTADRRELQALIADVAVERDLVAGGAALAFAGHEIGEIGLVAALAAIHEFR